MPRRRSPRKPRPVRFPILEPCAQRLECFRFQRGLSQSALAARASISTNHYQDIAHARANFTVGVLQRLAAALNVSIAELFEPEARPPDDRRTVPVADIEGLAAVHRELTDVVERLARQVEYTGVSLPCMVFECCKEKIDSFLDPISSTGSEQVEQRSGNRRDHSGGRPVLDVIYRTIAGNDRQSSPCRRTSRR